MVMTTMMMNNSGRIVVRKRDVPDLDVLVAPLVEQLDAANLAGDILGEDWVTLRALDLDFSGVRHVDGRVN